MNFGPKRILSSVLSTVLLCCVLFHSVHSIAEMKSYLKVENRSDSAVTFLVCASKRFGGGCETQGESVEYNFEEFQSTLKQMKKDRSHDYKRDFDSTHGWSFAGVAVSMVAFPVGLAMVAGSFLKEGIEGEYISIQRFAEYMDKLAEPVSPKKVMNLEDSMAPAVLERLALALFAIDNSCMDLPEKSLRRECVFSFYAQGN